MSGHLSEQHLSEEDLILLYYREPEARADGVAHLQECRACRESAKALAETLELCSALETPEPSVDYGRSTWAQLAPLLEDRPQRRWAWKPVWGLAGAFAALVAAFLIGRATVPSRGVPMTAGLSAQARQRILAISLADHLERAGMVLTEVANEGDPASQRPQAEDLVDEGRLLRQTLAESGESATLEIVDEVERVLVEVANTPDQINAVEVRRLRDRIDSGSLLFKAKVLETNLYKDGKTI